MSIETLITAAEFEKMAERLGPSELVRGEVVTLSPGGIRHNRVVCGIYDLLRDWMRQGIGGLLLTNETGLIVEQGPDTVRGADVVYFSPECLPEDTAGDAFSAVPPKLVVEVIGQHQGWRKTVQKAGEYLRMGVSCVWIVNPKTQRVHIHRPQAKAVVLEHDDVLSDEAILPGFHVRVGDLFRR